MTAPAEVFWHEERPLILRMHREHRRHAVFWGGLVAFNLAAVVFGAGPLGSLVLAIAFELFLLRAVRTAQVEAWILANWPDDHDILITRNGDAS